MEYWEGERAGGGERDNPWIKTFWKKKKPHTHTHIHTHNTNLLQNSKNGFPRQTAARSWKAAERKLQKR